MAAIVFLVILVAFAKATTAIDWFQEPLADDISLLNNEELINEARFFNLSGTINTTTIALLTGAALFIVLNVAFILLFVNTKISSNNAKYGSNNNKNDDDYGSDYSDYYFDGNDLVPKKRRR
jgi:hypothetical protein